MSRRLPSPSLLLAGALLAPTLSGQAVPAISDGADYQLSVRLYRETEHSAVVLQLRGLAGQSFQNELALNITEDGAVRFMDIKKETWIDSRLSVPPRVWTKVTIPANRRARTFGITIQPDGGELRRATVPGRLSVRPHLRNIVFIPQPPDSSVVFVDEVELTEVR